MHNIRSPLVFVICLASQCCSLASRADVPGETAVRKMTSVCIHACKADLPDCTNALVLCSSLFSPTYDSDLEIDRRWRDSIARGSDGQKWIYRKWEDTSRSFSDNSPAASFERLLLRSAKCIASDCRNDPDSCFRAVDSLPLEKDLKRALGDAVFFFAFASVTDDWEKYAPLFKWHEEIITAAEPGERTALSCRLARLLAQWNPLERGLIKDRVRYFRRAKLLESCVSDEGTRKISSFWVRCASVERDCREKRKRALSASPTALSEYRSGRIDESGVFHEGTLAEKRELLSVCFESGIWSWIQAGCCESVAQFPLEIAQSFGMELSRHMNLPKEEQEEFLIAMDFFLSAENGDVSGYWERKAARKGKSESSSTQVRLPDPGRLAPYAVSDALRPDLARYGLSAGMFVQESPDEPGKTNELAYLLFKPKRGGRQVPLVLFVPGSGELGNDLSRQFRQRTIFEKVTSAEFQKKHPCYLLVIAPPEDAPDLCGRTEDWRPGRFQRPFLSALACIAHAQNAPSVDMDRIYATGLSYGGRSIYGLSFVAPHLFAACVPVSSGVFSPEDVREERPGNWWHLYNEGDYARHPDSIPRLEVFAARVRELGGDFRIGTYPAEGHNAWDAAWREDALWDWMFSKSLANERPALIGGARSAKPARVDRSLAGKVVCTASKAGADAKRGPERAADGLDATAYVSTVPMEAGDWWLCEFKEPVTGRIRIQTGWLDGTKRLSRGHVEVSKDGKLWSRAAGVSQKTGEASFQQRDPIRFVKLLVEPRTPEVLTLRELRLE